MQKNAWSLNFPLKYCWKLSCPHNCITRLFCKSSIMQMTPVSSTSSTKFEHYLTMTAGISSLRTEIRELNASVLLNMQFKTCSSKHVKNVVLNMQFRAVVLKNSYLKKTEHFELCDPTLNFVKASFLLLHYKILVFFWRTLETVTVSSLENTFTFTCDHFFLR